MKYLGIMVIVPLFTFIIENLRRKVCRVFHIDSESSPMTHAFVLILATLATIIGMIILRKLMD